MPSPTTSASSTCPSRASCATSSAATCAITWSRCPWPTTSPAIGRKVAASPCSGWTSIRPRRANSRRRWLSTPAPKTPAIATTITPTTARPACAMRSTAPWVASFASSSPVVRKAIPIAANRCAWPGLRNGWRSDSTWACPAMAIARCRAGKKPSFRCACATRCGKYGAATAARWCRRKSCCCRTNCNCRRTRCRAGRRSHSSSDWPLPWRPRGWAGAGRDWLPHWPCRTGWSAALPAW